MKVIYPGLMALALLAGCNGNPALSTSTSTSTSTSGSGGTGTSGSGTTTTPATFLAVTPPPLTDGSPTPSPSSSISRQEALVTSSSSADYGNGYAQITPPSAANGNKFVVTNLAFTGNDVYTPDKTVFQGSGYPAGELNGFAVYDGPATATDSANGTQIKQLTYRALYGVSNTGKTMFAIVRTGSFVQYGFGGFLYSRTGGVTLPKTGQANFTGKYAGMQDQNGASGMQYTTGSMNVTIDFRAFDNTGSVKGTVSNRQIFNMAGQNITSQVLTDLNTNLQPLVPFKGSYLPVLTFEIGPNTVDANGEISGLLNNKFVNSSGANQVFESGQYYGVVSGNVAGGQGQITGIIVVTSSGGYSTSATTRETGGFTVYR